jgi:hypothetical protein
MKSGDVGATFAMEKLEYVNFSAHLEKFIDTVFPSVVISGSPYPELRIWIKLPISRTR